MSTTHFHHGHHDLHGIHGHHDLHGIHGHHGHHTHDSTLHTGTVSNHGVNQVQIGDCNHDCVQIKTDKGIDHNNFDIHSRVDLGKFDVTTNIHHSETVGQQSTHGEVCLSYHGENIHSTNCYRF